MDAKEYLIRQMKSCRKKMNLARLADYSVLFTAFGGIGGILCELASLFLPFYYAHAAALLCFAAGLLAGGCYAVYRRADMKQAAKRLDSFGLKERMITALEQMGQEDEFSRLQREDALRHYEGRREQIRIPLLPDKRHLLALLLSVAAAVALGVLPSPVREQAQLRHEVQEQAKEELEELEELLEALEGVDPETLTEEQRLRLEALSEALKLSGEELAEADSWQGLDAAMERLDYKYNQAAKSLEQLAAQLSDLALAGVASAEALAKAAANEGGQQTASAGNASAGASGNNDDKEGSGSGNDDGNGSNGGNGDGSGDGNGDGSGDGNGSGNGSGNGDGNGDGSGDGNGSGNGSGNGDGNGSGDGNGGGTGSGNGRGTGSSSTPHDYVSIPNDIGDDPSLTGEKTGDENSDYYRQQNGLAWEGQHVDYNSVIGQYTDNAYEGIANGRYPSGMESVIRDYFENLNK